MNQTSSEPILLKFLGGAGSVTGSMYLVRAASHTFLLECGLFQGPRQQAHQINSTFPFMPKDMEFLLLSHAHIDHSGNIPTLVKQGFRGKIYSTSATADLASVMLVDSAHIQIEDVEYLNRKLGLWGEATLKPLYAPEDVQAALPSFVSLPYQEERKVDPYLSFPFFDAGHILGSSIILLEVLRGNERIRICFTGDLGRKHLPILRDPYQVRNIAYLIVESTYGSSLHDPMEEVGRRLAEIINRAVAEKGKVIIPAFAIERAQEVLYEIFRLEEEKQIPEIPIFVDSPLTAEVTEIFQRHPECYDEELRQLLASDKDPFHFRRLRYIRSIGESKSLNRMPGSFLIISASGMCESGRILHHLIHGLPDPRNTILFVGFQAEGTLGRRITEGAKRVRILEGEYPVRARIDMLHNFSAHADRQDLLNYVAACGKGIKGIFLVHGEPDQAQGLAQGLAEMGYDNVHRPGRGDSFLLEDPAR